MQINSAVVSGTISNNNFNGNLLSGIELTGQGEFTSVRDIDIQFNTVTNNGQRGLLLFGGTSAFNFHATISNVLVNGNRFDGNGLDGIDINSTGNNTASRAGIDAVGNVTGGGNKATQNASCNTQGCF